MEEPKKKFLTVPKVTIGLGITGAGIWSLMDVDTFKSFISGAWKEDIIRMMIAFTFAGIVHRFIFRKDMEKYFMNLVTPIVDALNKIADKSDATDTKLNEINHHVVEHAERLLLVEQHMTPRQS